MPVVEILVPFRDNKEAKALGAYWDSRRKSMCVPHGLSLEPFSRWMGGEAGAVDHLLIDEVSDRIRNHSVALVVPAVEQERMNNPAHYSPAAWVMDLATPGGSGTKGVALSQLLSTVAKSIHAAFDKGVWTAVDVISCNEKNGHFYLEIAERDAGGVVLAKSSAMIWAKVARKILPSFESSTGVRLTSGIKILVRCLPVFKPQYGFSLEIEDIDSGYTLGDLEARKREIRTRLTREGLFDAQKKLPAPWDFNAILVVASHGAAGLGDFQAESDRLSKYGVCYFAYAYTRFQGEGAAAQICLDLKNALIVWRKSRSRDPDAVVFIRGGGASNDLAWLNDYELSKMVCQLEIPVLTGIGHEKDTTLLDEVAHLSFDTPSKVILGIEKIIALRAREAHEFFKSIENKSKISIALVRTRVDLTGRELEANARHQIELARLRAQETFNEVKKSSAQVLQLARQVSSGNLNFVLERGMSHILRVQIQVKTGFESIEQSASRVIQDARGRVKGLIREILVQGPNKTLSRGFVMVSSDQQVTLMRASDVRPGDVITVRFFDGAISAVAGCSMAGQMNDAHLTEINEEQSHVNDGK